MTDIVERLCSSEVAWPEMRDEAANEIKRLRAVLRYIADGETDPIDAHTMASAALREKE